MKIIAIDVPELGNRSYIVHDGTIGIVIDPSRRTAEFIAAAKKAKIEIGAVFETHVHNDYVTGGYALAQQLAKPYYVSAHEQVGFERQDISPEQSVRIGTLEVIALASPGHTHHHLAYLVTQKRAKPALFSGGSLLYGAVGRTDLVSAEATVPLAKAQYRTAQFFVDRLDPATELYPTHGFGSFCAATETEHVAVSTMKHQMKTNQAYTAKNESSFVKELLKNLDAYPAYYAQMAPSNAKGPTEPNLAAPKRLTREAVLRALHDGAAIIDMRSRTAYAAEHLAGTYNIELGNSLATYAGWLFAWETPLILVAATSQEITIAHEQLSLIGREIVAGKIAATDLLKSTNQATTYPVCTFADLPDALARKHVTVLDVRRRLEWQKGHLPQAKHVPLHELTMRLDELPSDTEVWVHCASGFRAGIAASILSGNGYHPVLIDDNYENAKKAGLFPVKKRAFVAEIAAGKAQLLDVRDDAEWQTGHAKGALHIPVGQLLSEGLEALPKNARIYLYCASGQRSGMAEQYLTSQGYHATNIGGLSDWVQAGGSIITK
jgi:hydroxyacylglutathione hydrolase